MAVSGYLYLERNSPFLRYAVWIMYKSYIHLALIQKFWVCILVGYTYKRVLGGTESEICERGCVENILELVLANYIK